MKIWWYDVTPCFVARSPSYNKHHGNNDGHIMGISWANISGTSASASLKGESYDGATAIFFVRCHDGHVQQSLFKTGLSHLGSNTYLSCFCSSPYMCLKYPEMVLNTAFMVHLYIDMIVACGKHFSCSCMRWLSLSHPPCHRPQQNLQWPICKTSPSWRKVDVRI